MSLPKDLSSHDQHNPLHFAARFRELLCLKPRYNLKQVGAENCDFADTAVKSKSCYYCFGIFYSEDVYYARYSRKCVSSSGLTFCVNCEWCTECVDCANCQQVDYSQDCQNCSNCQFCKDCYGCRDCFGCSGLAHKQYRMFNEQLSQAEYEHRIKNLDLSQETHRQAVRERVEKLRRTVPSLGIHQFNCENCLGNHLTECSNCYRCHDSFALEDCMYCIETNGNKNCCDLTVCFESQWCYQCIHSPLNYNSNFLFHCDYCVDSEFCAFSKNLKNCFGCVYLQNKEYHILNTPYTPEAYEQTVAQVRAELQQTGTYNLELYFASEYEQKRLRTETDSAIQPLPPV